MLVIATSCIARIVPICPVLGVQFSQRFGSRLWATKFGGDPYLGDSVGVGAIGDLGRTRAVRLVRSNDLGGVGHIGGSRVGRVAGRDASDEGSSSKSELHFA